MFIMMPGATTKKKSVQRDIIKNTPEELKRNIF